MMETKQIIDTPLGTIEITVVTMSMAKIQIGKMPCTMTNGMNIDYTTAALISIEPTVLPIEVEILAKIQGDAYSGSAASGEYLDCMEWESDEWHVTLGTEDSEMLCSRYPSLSGHESQLIIGYLEDGLSININSSILDTRLTFHMLVSSKQKPDERDCTAWFFADVPHDSVRKAIDGGSRV